MTSTQAETEVDPQLVRARARIGTLLQDKWRLEALLGVGGMAAVYAATHRNGKRVAVKMLHEDFSHDEEVRKRFLQEGYAANTIQHEGAVSVLDDDLAPDGSAFLVMELLQGETVESRWEARGGRMPLEEVLAIGDQLLDVLASAHAKNVVHRDIKPENLFITRSGVLKVLDFGIAKIFERRETRTATRAGTVMGTPAFMAPEQARARWEQVDGRTDLWAVGATLFTLLSGRHVHEAPSTQEQLIMSATAPAPPLASVVPGIPDDVATIVDRALAFDRSQRWADARTMQKAIRDALEARGIKPEAWAARTTIGHAPTLATGAYSGVSTLATAVAKTSVTSTLIKQREARLTEVTKLRTAVGDLQDRYSNSKRQTAEAQSKLEEGLAERKALEQWFNRRVGTRTAAIDEARSAVRTRMIAIARRALTDTNTFGAEFESLRNRVVTRERAAISAARDVKVHEAALAIYDPRALRTGVLITFILVLVLIVAPIVWRATRVVEVQLPKASAPAR